MLQKMRRILSITSLFILSAFLTSRIFIANADDLIIQSDGGVILVITNGGVLGVSTTGKNTGLPSLPSTPTKVVPLVPPHVDSTIKITPPVNNGKKVQVTITPAPSTVSTKPSVTIIPGNTITKTVDQVVAQGANGQSIISVKSEHANELIIKQGETKVSTSLPLQFNTVSHSLSVPLAGRNAKVSVLPQEAVVGAEQKGFLNRKELSNVKINLAPDSNAVDYVLSNEKSGKLFGVFSIKGTEELKLSAENGTTIQVSRPIIFNLLGPLIK